MDEQEIVLRAEVLQCIDIGGIFGGFKNADHFGSVQFQQFRLCRFSRWNGQTSFKQSQLAASKKN